MLNNYRAKELHVTTRSKFPEALKANLIDGKFTNWKNHPQFIMSGAALHGFHNRLRDACNNLIEMLNEEVLNYNENLILHWRLISYARQIINVAHSHHHAEDSVYFPQYQALFPQLIRPLSLLDQDHRVLEQALDDLQRALDQLDDKSPIGNWESARDKAAHLGRIIHRHLDDEEEIVMPAIMRRDA